MNSAGTSWLAVLEDICGPSARKWASRRCPSVGALTAFLKDRLPSPARDTVALHLERCEECQKGIRNLREFTTPCPSSDKIGEAPRSIRDLAYCRMVEDTVRRIDLIFGNRDVRIKAHLAVVPDFFKRRRVPCGLTPQQYLTRILIVLMQLAPPGGTLRLGADSRVFRVSCPGVMPRGRIASNMVELKYKRAWRGIDAALFLALHPIWLVYGDQLYSAASSLPATISKKLTQRGKLALFRQLSRALFGPKDSRRKARSEDFLKWICELPARKKGAFIRNLAAAVPPELAKMGIPSLFPWAELMKLVESQKLAGPQRGLPLNRSTMQAVLARRGKGVNVYRSFRDAFSKPCL